MTKTLAQAPAEHGPHRLVELDSMRGLAALSVVLSHLMHSVPNIAANTAFSPAHFAVNLLKYTPLYIFWHGTAAVYFFFVLSGLVLAFPFVEGKGLPYPAYVLRRICRIWVPYVAMISLAIGVTYFVSRPPQPSVWLAAHGPQIAAHYTLVGTFDSERFDSPVWSLVHEMRISLVFPLIVIAVLRVRWFWSLAGAAIVYYASGALSHHWGMDQMYTSILMTLHLALPFVVGIILARNWQACTTSVAAWSSGARVALLAAAVAAYTYAGWSVYLPAAFRKYFVNDGMVFLACAALIVLAVASPNLQSTLQRGPLVFLGRISYSLYLLHMPVLAVVTHACSPGTSLVIVCALTLAGSLGIATLSYRWVERPAMVLGRRLTAGAKRQPSPQGTASAT